MKQEELNEVLKQHKLWLDTKGEEGKRADLSYVNLRYAGLSDANLRGADLRNADLRYANLECVILSGANLRDAKLACAYLRDAKLACADLRGADLRFADLIDADLRDSNLRGADLTGTGIHPFEGPKHDATYNSKDGILFIGCQVHSLDYWLKNYVDIGKEHEYTDKEIEEYGQWIKSLKELPK